jgi:hypothetical protein
MPIFPSRLKVKKYESRIPSFLKAD